MKSYIPNFFTLGNLSCGLVAVLYDNLNIGLILVVIAMLFDVLDGFAARLLGIQSEIGAQLDSFADIVTFGVASIVIYQRMFSLSVFMFLSSSVFVCCAAYRLAKFNLEEPKSYFSGMPTPFASFALLSIAFYLDRSGILLSQYSWGESVHLAIPILLGLLMVIPLGMFSLKSLSLEWRNLSPFVYMLIIAIGVSFFKPNAFGILFTFSYLFISIIYKNRFV